MLGKLIKYEFKATYRVFALIFSGVLFLAIINRMLFGFAENSWNYGINRGLENFLTIITGISVTLYGLFIMAMFVVLTIVIIQRFYKNLFTDEGYLMHTLPVSPWMHIISKMLVATLWSIVSFIVVTISVFILLSFGDILYDFLHYVLIDFIYDIKDFYHELKMPWAGKFFNPVDFLFFELFLTFIVGLFFGLTPLYASITIGQMFRKHRILGAFLSYVALGTVYNFINRIGIFIITSIFSEQLYIPYSPFYGTFRWLTGFAGENIWFFIIFITFNLLTMLLYYAGCFFSMQHLMKNKLDLQ